MIKILYIVFGWFLNNKINNNFSSLRIDFRQTNFLQMACNANYQILRYKLHRIYIAYFAVELVQGFPDIIPETKKQKKNVVKYIFHFNN